jgi:hypothetical protein
MTRTPRLAIAQCVAAVLAWNIGAPPAAATELQQKTVDAFDRYVRLSETRMDGEERGSDSFLYTDRLARTQKAEAQRQARGPTPFMARLQTRDGARSIEVPDGLIHHWVGLIFMPGVTTDQAVALMQDYDRHADVFRPVIVRSKLLGHEGDRFRFYLRFYVKKVIGVTTDTEHEAVFGRPAPDRAFSRLHSTRVAEVENADTPTERQKPVGSGRGFLWRLNTYWRFAERDGGTWVQCESITLTRDIPTALGWLVGRFVTEIPKESLTFTLATARKALVKGTTG